MKRTSVCIAVGLLVAGCAGQSARPPVTEVTRIPEQGGWFCQLGPDREGWQCVRDSELSEDPVPQRLPKPPPSPASEPLPPATGFDGRATDASAGDSTGDSTDNSVEAPAPDPAEPGSLMQVPQHFYALQVVAMASRTELDDFVSRHGLEGLPSARVERDGELYYVLLAGVYESLTAARRAMSDLPPPLQGIDPWIRPVGSLQAAMSRADALASSGGA